MCSVFCLSCHAVCSVSQAWHAWAVMNFEAVLHYKHQNQGRDDKKKLRHASGASANGEASNSESEADSNDNSPAPSPLQKKVNEVEYVCVLREPRIGNPSDHRLNSEKEGQNPEKI